MNIFLIGEVSSGKSSLLNALAGGIISNASMQRETINPEIYEFDVIDKAYPSFKKMATILESKHVTNKKFDDKTAILNEPKFVCDITGQKIIFKSQFEMGKFYIYDFPGVNDAKNDSNDVFFEQVKTQITNCNCLVYVTKAETAFLNQSELTLFKKIVELCDICREKRGKYTQICIVINKFDNPYDIDMDQIANQVKSKINNDKIEIYRMSSHRLFLESIVKNNLNVPIPEFLHQEIKKIFQNATAVITKEQAVSIKKHGKISHKYIKFNEEIESNKLELLDQDIDSNSDSDSDFKDNSPNPEKTVPKPEYREWKYEGDWNNFINFIKEEKHNLPENRFKTRNKWLQSYLDKVSNITCERSTPEFINTCSHFIDIVDVFQKSGKMDSFMTHFVTFFDSIITRPYICSTLTMHIFSLESLLEKQHRSKLLSHIENKISILKGQEIPDHYIHLLFYGLFDTYRLNSDVLVQILKEKLVWNTSNMNYWNITLNNQNQICNNSNPKFKTFLIEKIMQHKHFIHRFQPTDGKDIHMLIKLSLMKIDNLILLDHEKELSYDLIKKYLGQVGCLRTKIYLRKSSDRDNIPYLFNDDPKYSINTEILEYIQARNDLFTD